MKLELSEKFIPWQDDNPSRFRTLGDWLDWQERSHFPEVALGLDRCRAVARQMGLLSPSFKAISVAGTNGKGSCVGMLGNILAGSGYLVGCYTSPHLMRYNERITISGVEVNDSEIMAAFADIDAARGEISLTYFEFGTLAALEIFRQRRVDVALLEVGLGGRLDAVNLIDADAALISTIDFDHREWLGSTRDEIGYEKAGIMRPHVPVICTDSDPPRSLCRHAKQTAARLYLHGRDYRYRCAREGWDWYGTTRCRVDLPYPRFNFPHKVQNAAGVLALLDAASSVLPVSEGAIRDGIENFSLPGRFQLLPGSMPIVLDVAHNPQAARVLADSLQRLYATGNNHFVIGLLKDKDHAEIFRELLDVANSWTMVDLCEPRGTAGGVLAGKLRSLGCTAPISVAHTVSAAVQSLVRHIAQPDRIVVTGSFLVVGPMLESASTKITASQGAQ